MPMVSWASEVSLSRLLMGEDGSLASFSLYSYDWAGDVEEGGDGDGVEERSVRDGRGADDGDADLDDGPD